MSTAVVWFRRDVRLADNPALAQAVREHDRVAPVFCFEEPLLRGRRMSPRRNAYLLEALAGLDEGLKRIGGALLYREGDPAAEIPKLAAECGAEAVYVNEDHTPHSVRRDRRVARALSDADVAFESRTGLTIADVREIRTQEGGPYKVFTPFSKAWQAAPRRAVEDRPSAVRLPDVPKGRAPAAADLGIDEDARRVARAARPGEEAARRAVQGYLRRGRNGPADYKKVRDLPGLDATTRWSIPLHYGCVSPLELESWLKRLRGPGPIELRRQLAWRDFWLHLLRHFPANRELEFDQRFRGLPWGDDAEALEAWKQGRTGFPLVDAGMRQLAAEGWMHNRARMTVATVLTKHLGVDWREGEAHFMEMLLDGDMAQNNGNWQWAASVGADAVPYFRLISPTRQQQRFDPDGTYVRRWVPELAAFPNRHLAEPWKASDEEQQGAGCIIGADYAEPIVDLDPARDAALARFKQAAGD
jgi:deoxyribodipyrimidine photo-lyase